jgi:hypothetical protein
MTAPGTVVTGIAVVAGAVGKKTLLLFEWCFK